MNGEGVTATDGGLDDLTCCRASRVVDVVVDSRPRATSGRRRDARSSRASFVAMMKATNFRNRHDGAQKRGRARPQHQLQQQERTIWLEHDLRLA
jgi:hypothetical protein